MKTGQIKLVAYLLQVAALAILCIFVHISWYVWLTVIFAVPSWVYLHIAITEFSKNLKVISDKRKMKQYHAAFFDAEILGREVQGQICFEAGFMYLCFDEAMPHKGGEPINKLGYKYGWFINDASKHSLKIAGVSKLTVKK